LKNYCQPTGKPLCCPNIPNNAFGNIRTARTYPSLHPVSTVSWWLTFNSALMDWGCPGYQSDMSPHLPKDDRQSVPSWVPHRTLFERFMMTTLSNSSYMSSDWAYPRLSHVVVLLLVMSSTLLLFTSKFASNDVTYRDVPARRT
jgi:hypothetical protein